MFNKKSINLKFQRSRFYITGNADFSILSTHRPETPDDDTRYTRHEHYLDKNYKLCLNCPLDKCYRDGMRDDNSPHDKIVGKELCPIEVTKNG